VHTHLRSLGKAICCKIAIALIDPENGVRPILNECKRMFKSTGQIVLRLAFTTYGRGG
jgi:hypothetical protein